METGTLKELNVKPGDVVSFMNADAYKFIIESVDDNFADGKSVDNGRISPDQWSLTATSGWRIISRATPAPDLTAITTPFGLLDDETQEALRAHGGPYEYWYDGEWYETNNTDHDSLVHRAKATPITKSITCDAYIHPSGIISKIESDRPQPVRVTFNRINGAIDLASYKVEPR